MKVKTHIIPELYGLVLLGGKSVRMGHDKSLIDYHGCPQWEYVAQLLSRLTAKTYLSGRQEQVGSIDSNCEILVDMQEGLGPISGLLAAFRKHPDKAWLVMAIDMPKMDLDGLRQLIDARDSTKLATAFRGYGDRPEPLVAIWEPQSQQKILAYFAQAIYSPIQILVNEPIKMVTPKHPQKLQNVNQISDWKG